jgi:6-phosphogluconolactonase
MLPANTQVLADAEAVAQQACVLIAEAARQAVGERGVFRLVLAGGGTPQRAYALLAQTQQDWGQWEVFWGDERCLPVDHVERNSHVMLPAKHLFPIPAELGAEAAAVAYAQTLTNKLPFDLVLLGMGEDGHTASLFPGNPSPPGPHTQPVHNAPKPPPDRVSLTVAALQNCRQQLVLVTGAGKVDALTQWRKGERLPIAVVVREDACLLVDAAAYGE